MGFEIDFLPVGDGEKSGDAIALRYGNLHGGRDEQKVIVVDGGFKDSAAKLVEHIRYFYGTDYVDLVVSTHPDNDHVSGLSVVLDELEVGELWMHLPWNYDSEVSNFVSGKSSKISRPKLRKSLQAACELESLAKRKGIPIKEPFKGLSFDGGKFVVVGPSIDFYKQLLPEFQTEAPKSSLAGTLFKEGKEFIQKIAEDWGMETLSDDGETSPQNESSVISVLDVEGKTSLLTADAGQRALTEVLNLFDSIGFDVSALNFVQVPHHGSQRNVGPAVLDRLLGPRLHSEQKLRTAFVSACPDDNPKHPSKKVMNAFRRRGAPVHATKGSSKMHFHDAPDRGWEPSTPLPFFYAVDE